jgi:hypothetical protein
VSEDLAGELTEEALALAGLADMRPAYRRLLVRLKQESPTSFEEATRRYREELEPAIASGDSSPLCAWLGYGAWLAGRFSEGRAMAIDPTGRARPFDPASEPEAGSMVLYLPDDDRAPATLLAVPTDPTDSQKETADLLVR